MQIRGQTVFVRTLKKEQFGRTQNLDVTQMLYGHNSNHSNPSYAQHHSPLSIELVRGRQPIRSTETFQAAMNSQADQQYSKQE